MGGPLESEDAARTWRLVRPREHVRANFVVFYVTDKFISSNTVADLPAAILKHRFPVRSLRKR